MKTTLNKKVLVLNKNWVALRIRTVKEVVRLASRNRAVIIDSNDYSLYTWKEWIYLEPKEGEEAIATSSGDVKIPEVILLTAYGKVPVSTPRLTKKNIFRRDNSTCQYTGKPVTPKTANIDHIIPVSRGGKNTWENMVVCSKDINNKKGDKTPSEAGLELIKKPKRPVGRMLLLDPKMEKPESWRKFLR